MTLQEEVDAKKLTVEQAFDLGREHGAEMARDSRSADSGVDGWDGMLINADVQFARQAFGWDGIDSSEKAKQLLRKYAEGCQAGADAVLADMTAVE